MSGPARDDADPRAAASDEDALGWAGETDASLIDSRLNIGRSEPTGRSEPAAGGEDGGDHDAPVPAQAERTGTSSLLLVTYGILGGVYLIFTIGWIITAQRNGYSIVGVLPSLMFQLGEALAVAAPALWFGAAFALTRERPTVVRLLWILVGLAVVLPWPFVLGI